MSKKKIILLAVLINLLFFAIGFFIGNKVSNKNSEPIIQKIVEVKWKKGSVIRDTIISPVPVDTIIYDSILIPADPLDTSKLFSVWKDYYSKKIYSLDFSNDSIGTFLVDASVNQNKLISATSFIQPNIRTVYEKEFISKQKKWSPWAMIGTSVDFSTNKLQVGLDYNQRYVIGLSGIRMDNKYGYTIDLGIKFNK